jgi:hypothetical protein
LLAHTTKIIVLSATANYIWKNLMSPMVKALQELSEENKSQQYIIDFQHDTIEDLLKRVEALEKKQ